MSTESYRQCQDRGRARGSRLSLRTWKALSLTLLLLGSTTASAQQRGTAAPPPSGSGGQSPAAAPVGQAAPPRCDANCVRVNAGKAADACAPRIEAQAPSDFDWIVRPNPGIFQQADPSSPSDSVVRFRGDSIRFMAPDRSWLRVSYECAYDVSSQAVVFVHVHAGRLDQPIPTAAPIAGPQPAHPPAQMSVPIAAAQPQAQRPPRPHVGEPSPVIIQQEVDNPRR